MNVRYCNGFEQMKYAFVSFISLLLVYPEHQPGTHPQPAFVWKCKHALQQN